MKILGIKYMLLVVLLVLVGCTGNVKKTKPDVIGQINQDILKHPSALGVKYYYLCNDGSDMNLGESADDAFFSYDHAVEQIKYNADTEDTYLLMCKGGEFTATSINKDPYLDSDIGGNTEVSNVAETYYIDCESGNDDNDGISPQSAWASASKVLTKTSVGYWDTAFPNFFTRPTFHTPWTAANSGSTFLFKRGCSFDGFINVHAWTPRGYMDEYTFGAYGDLKQPRPIINDKEGDYHRSIVWSNGHSIHLSNLQLNVNHDISALNIDMRTVNNGSINNVVVTNSFVNRFGDSNVGGLLKNNLLFNTSDSELAVNVLVSNLGMYSKELETKLPVILDARESELSFSIQVTEDIVAEEIVAEEQLVIARAVAIEIASTDPVSLYGNTYGIAKDAGETDEYGIDGVNYSGNTYYIDCELGKDSNDGLSSDTPWLSLEKVNTKTSIGYWDTASPNELTNPQYHEPWTAAPSGSAFLFKRGCSFDGYINVHAISDGVYVENLTFGAYGDTFKARPIIKSTYATQALRATVWTNGHTIALRNLQILNDPKLDKMGVSLSKTSGCSLVNVVIKDASRDGIYADDANDLLISNSLIENNQLSGGRGGGFAGSGDNLKILNSTFKNNGRDKIGAHNIYVRHLHNATIQGNHLEGGSNLGVVLHGSSDIVLIKGNLIEGNSNGIDVTGGYAEAEVFNNITIEGNIIRNNGYREGEQGYGILLNSITNSQVINNLVVGNRIGTMSLFDSRVGDTPSESVVVAHNTFVEPASSYGATLGGEELVNISLVNNIFVHYGDDKVILTKKTDAPLSELNINHNLYFMPNKVDNKFFNFNGITYDLDQIRADFNVGFSAISSDPDFVDEEQFDYHLNNTSPAIAAGIGVIDWDFLQKKWLQKVVVR